MSKGREEFESLPAEEQLKILWPRISVMIKIIKETKLNYEKFLIPQGKMSETSMTYNEFMKGYKLLFPQEFKNENN